MISGQKTLVWVPSLTFKSLTYSKVYLQKAMPKFYSTLDYKILFFIKSQLEHHICNNATFMSRFPHCALFYVRFDFHLRPIHVLLSTLYFDFILIIRWVSVVEFHDRALGIGKVFGQESTVVKWNYQILGLHQVRVH